MAESTGAVKHVLLAKFKDPITSEQIDELIKGYARLVDLIEPMKSFHCWAPYSCMETALSDTDIVNNSASLFVVDIDLGRDALESIRHHHWGTDVSAENLHQGFTHVFESTFDSVEGIAEYVAHSAHVEFANRFIPSLEKVIVVDYKPTKVVL